MSTRRWFVGFRKLQTPGSPLSSAGNPGASKDLACFTAVALAVSLQSSHTSTIGICWYFWGSTQNSQEQLKGAYTANNTEKTLLRIIRTKRHNTTPPRSIAPGAGHALLHAARDFGSFELAILIQNHLSRLRMANPGRGNLRVSRFIDSFLLVDS